MKQVPKDRIAEPLSNGRRTKGERYSRPGEKDIHGVSGPGELTLCEVRLGCGGEHKAHLVPFVATTFANYNVDTVYTPLFTIP
jgi:hypothetical protein